MAKKEKIRTIDLTPTWSAVLPIFIAALQDGTPEGQRAAKEELARMAALADQYVWIIEGHTLKPTGIKR
jgi:hypothetical protein